MKDAKVGQLEGREGSGRVKGWWKRREADRGGGIIGVGEIDNLAAFSGNQYTRGNL